MKTNILSDANEALCTVNNVLRGSSFHGICGTWRGTANPVTHHSQKVAGNDDDQVLWNFAKAMTMHGGYHSLPVDNGPDISLSSKYV